MGVEKHGNMKPSLLLLFGLHQRKVFWKHHMPVLKTQRAFPVRDVIKRKQHKDKLKFILNN